ncbi:MAG: salicylate synthetase [Candidatus Kentron sp. G]|nr:MAG: salicylate synthetase [Candidatus Kentron sp. G]VFN01850.1 MAG: salicylate synthetase [Candidatus Kentron sp. G]VFN03070.1 MAG: salicylate synthetase [Candidatus Kentron sp. G]
MTNTRIAGVDNPLAKMRLFRSPFTDGGNAAAAAYDALAILHGLRQQNIVTPPYYLHIHGNWAEIGWHAAQHIAYLDGEKSEWDTWAGALRRLGDQAGAQNTKAFGYLGFDAWDHTQGRAPDESAEFPLMQFFIPAHRLLLTADRIEAQGISLELLRDIAEASRLEPNPPRRACRAVAEFPKFDYIAAVERTKRTLSHGLSKVVLSRYRSFAQETDLSVLFQDYCLGEKYADAVLMDFGSVGAAIASPELLMGIADGAIRANPLAGTRSLGAFEAENERIARSLLSDRKELAEHILALRQMMGELQPHCAPDTLTVSKLLDTARQNKVMHLSSELRGRLREDRHCVDALLALFPSAMVSGVPKAEAIRLIRRSEPFPRGLFGGTAGWLSGRSCRFALNIRGIYRYGQRLFVQAGAGVMAESDAARENAEVEMKMAAMLDALAGG